MIILYGTICENDKILRYSMIITIIDVLNPYMDKSFQLYSLEHDVNITTQNVNVHKNVCFRYITIIL